MFKSNNVDGTDVKAEHPKKQDANVVAATFELKRPDGTVDIVVTDENVSVKVVANGEYANISEGIDVILVPLINDA
jgi:hypothetical protein